MPCGKAQTRSTRGVTPFLMAGIMMVASGKSLSKVTWKTKSQGGFR